MSGAENLADAVRDWLLQEGCLAPHTYPGLGTESPIENLFFRAVIVANCIGVSWFRLAIGPTAPKDNAVLVMETQASLHGILRADFLFTVTSDDGVISRLVVECDGHEFHERTKEQAERDRSRDRALQERGYTVFRFTGSELHRDAFACARQVLRWAENAAWRKQ